MVTAGQKVRVRVVSVDPGSNKIALTMRTKEDVQAAQEAREQPREPAGEGAAARSGRERLGKIATRGVLHVGPSCTQAVPLPSIVERILHGHVVHVLQRRPGAQGPMYSRAEYCMISTPKECRTGDVPCMTRLCRRVQLPAQWLQQLMYFSQAPSSCKSGGGGGQRKQGGAREKPKTTHQVGESLKAVVVTTTAYGAFVRLPDGTEALLHVSEMAAPADTVSPQARDLVKPEDEIEVRRPTQACDTFPSFAC